MLPEIYTSYNEFISLMNNKPMVQFTTTIEKAGYMGEKTGWTYIIIPADIAQQLIPGNKKAFRGKGFLDDYKIEGIALLPIGGGDFMMPLNATMRKAIRKRKGAILNVKLEVDTNPIKPPADFVECLKDEPKAFEYYYSLTKGNQNYFSKWIESAKTEQTKSKRIAQAVTALSKGQNFGEMLRSLKKERKDFLR
jgi:Bacteriocin-protection, YdeI or OmpD-Associated/Domain of unknown function (DUF1905)